VGILAPRDIRLLIGGIMCIRKNVFLILGICFALFVMIGVKANAATPADVTGTWTVNVSGDAGSAEQTAVLKQDGGKITGTFKGPRQSGQI
jgi:hypothetical protein